MSDGCVWRRKGARREIFEDTLGAYMPFTQARLFPLETPQEQLLSRAFHVEKNLTLALRLCLPSQRLTGATLNEFWRYIALVFWGEAHMEGAQRWTDVNLAVREVD